MTDRKHFKQLVRERMRQTGERYTVARRHVAADATPEWELRGGLRRRHRGLRQRARQPRRRGGRRAAVGGDGPRASAAGSARATSCGSSSRTATRRSRSASGAQWQYPARWAAELAERLGLHAEIHETGGAKGAAAALDAQLDRGLPAIAWVDPYRLGLRGLPASRDGFGGPPVVVYERTGDGYAIDDRSRVRETVSADVLAAARGRVGSYKHRLIAIDPELVDVSEERLRDAVREGLRLQVEHLSASLLVVLAAGLAQVGADDHRHAQRQGLADRSSPTVAASRARWPRSTRARRAARTCAGCTRGSSTTPPTSSPARGCATPPRPGARRRRAWDAIVDTALPPGDELRALIDAGDHEARWSLQAQRDQACELPGADGAGHGDVRGRSRG